MDLRKDSHLEAYLNTINVSVQKHCIHQTIAMLRQEHTFYVKLPVVMGLTFHGSMFFK